MSAPSEQMHQRIKALIAAGMTPEKLQAVSAAGSLPGAAPPEPVEYDDRSLTERISGAAAGFAEPLVKTAQGIEDLLGTASPETQAQYKTVRKEIERQKPPGARGTATNILGEMALMAAPASGAYRLTRAMTAGKPFVQRVAPITAESAAIGAMEGLKMPEDGESRLERGIDAALLQGGGAAAQAALRKVVDPRLFRRTEAAQEEARALAAAGITPDIPITLGTEGRGPVSMPAAWALRGPALGTPGSKGRLSRQIDKATGDWRRMMATRAVPPGVDISPPPFKPGEAPMEATLRGIKDFYKREYREVLDPHTFDVVSMSSPLGGRINTAISRVPGREAQKQVIQKVGDLLRAKVDGSGKLPGARVSDLKTALRAEIRLAKDGAVAKGYRDVMNAIDDGVADGIRAVNPAHAQRYEALREPYKHFVVLDDAVGRASQGEFQPKELRSAALRHARKNKMNQREAVYRGEAQRAEEVYDLPPKTRDSNVFQLRALGNVLLGGGAGLGASMAHPLGAAYTGLVAGTTVAGIPRLGQKILMSETTPQLILADLLRKPGIEELSRAARIGGGQYVAD